MALGELVLEYVGECVLEALSYLTGRAAGVEPERARTVGGYVLFTLFVLGLVTLTIKYS